MSAPVIDGITFCGAWREWSCPCCGSVRCARGAVPAERRCTSCVSLAEALAPANDTEKEAS